MLAQVQENQLFKVIQEVIKIHDGKPELINEIFGYDINFVIRQIINGPDANKLMVIKKYRDFVLAAIEKQRAKIIERQAKMDTAIEDMENDTWE